MHFLLNFGIFLYLAIQKKFIFSINLETCTDQEYFNSVSLTCQTCSSNENKVINNNNQCVCDSRFYLTENGCETCEEGACPNSDKTQCMELVNKTITNCSASENGFLTEKTIFGAGNKLILVNCGENAIYDPNTNDCKCNNEDETYYNGNCNSTPEYTTNDEQFFRRWTDTNESRITESNTPITSSFFSSLYPKARLGCDVGDIKSCQVLANLCVLKMYDETTLPCRELLPQENSTNTK